MTKHTQWKVVTIGFKSGFAEIVTDDGEEVVLSCRKDHADRIVQCVNTRDSLIAALKLATNELNAIRARDGAPQHIDWFQGRPLQTDSCTKEWWNELTEKCYAAIKSADGLK